MIDDKEIDIAARVQALSKHINETTYFQLRSIEDFKDGARWAINEFLKDLWHDASEEPKMTNQENEFVECLVKFKDGIVYLYNYDTWHHWWCSDEDNQKFLGLIDKWLYIDDLLTKKKEVSND